MLKAVSIQSGYGDLRVIDRLSLHVNRGEVVALLGANGAGKSTLLGALAGLVPLRAGRLLWGERDIAPLPAEGRAALGITLVPEGRGLFPGMSVLDNLHMGGYARKMSARELGIQVVRVCEQFPALTARMRDKAGNLSGGQQQMLALGRALIGQPELLLLDEPSTGLAPLMVAEIFAHLRRLKAAGTTLVLAEQNVHQALALADRVYVLENGHITLQGPAAELQGSEALRKAYLGS